VEAEASFSCGQSRWSGFGKRRKMSWTGKEQSVSLRRRVAMTG
jgi:hypothetical protein